MLLALSASLLWGMLSVVLSPCHLSSIPLVVGYINGQGEVTGRRGLFLSSLFGLGILTTIGIVGAVTVAAGGIIGDAGRWGDYMVAGVFFLVGLWLLEVIRLPWPRGGKLGSKYKGGLGALALGLAFGIGLGPCTFAYMAPIMAVTFRSAGSNTGYGIAMLGAYGVGHCAVIVAAGTCTGWVQGLLDWNERSRGMLMFRRVLGVLVLAGGVYMIYTAR